MDQDTSPEQQEKYRAHLRRLDIARRVRIIEALCADVRRLAEAGIRMAEPGLSDDEVRIRVAERMYGRAAADILRRRLARE